MTISVSHHFKFSTIVTMLLRNADSRVRDRNFRHQDETQRISGYRNESNMNGVKQESSENEIEMKLCIISFAEILNISPKWSSAKFGWNIARRRWDGTKFFTATWWTTWSEIFVWTRCLIEIHRSTSCSWLVVIYLVEGSSLCYSQVILRIRQCYMSFSGISSIPWELYNLYETTLPMVTILVGNRLQSQL